MPYEFPGHILSEQHPRKEILRQFRRADGQDKGRSRCILTGKAARRRC